MCPATRAPIIIDLEASGFGRGSYPIEVGCALADGSAFCTLIRPAPPWTHWDPAAERLHGISRDNLVHHGRPVDEVAQMLNERLDGETVYSDAWYHDYTWLAVLFAEAGMTPRFRVEHLARLLSEDHAQRWNRAHSAIQNEQQSTRHRASADARVLQLTWLRVVRGY